MAYKVDYQNIRTTSERAIAGAGEYTATLEFWKYKEYTDMNGVTLKNIMFLWVTDLDEVAFDTIYQNIDDEGEYLVYQEWKMNLYSKAFGLQDGVHFETIDEWADSLVGKQAVIVVDTRTTANGDERSYIKEVNPYEQASYEVNDDDTPF